MQRLGSRLSSGVLRSTGTDAQLFGIGWDPADFVRQSDPELCWAAAVTMAFRHLGWQYQEAQFAKVNRQVCGMAATRSATLNQIVFALTHVHKGTGIWLVDAGWQSGPMAISQFAGLDSRATLAGIHLISDTSGLLDAMLKGHPVIAGIDQGGRMHVVMIVAVHARPGGLLAGSQLILMHGKTRIEAVRYVDPQEGPATLDMSGEELLRSTRFAFELAA